MIQKIYIKQNKSWIAILTVIIDNSSRILQQTTSRDREWVKRASWKNKNRKIIKIKWAAMMIGFGRLHAHIEAHRNAIIYVNIPGGKGGDLV